MTKFSCPIPYISLSLEAGLKRRLCCHDNSQETEDLDVETIIEDGLSNTELSKKIISSFQKGEIPQNCDFCFELEQKGILSPRNEYIKKFSNSDLKEKKIKYLDITVDNNCNLKCRTCHPKYSSQLKKEFEELNIPYDKDEYTLIENIITQDYIPLLNFLSNDSLITITGGEPFISSKSQELVEYLVNNYNTQEMTIRFFTNATVFPKWLKAITTKFKRVEILFSLDASGALANYICFPSSWEKIHRILELYVSNFKASENVSMYVHSVLLIYNFGKIHKLINDLKSFDNYINIIPRTTVISSPKLLSPTIIPEEEFNSLKENELDKLKSILKELKDETKIREMKNLIRLIDSLESSYNPDDYTKYLIHTRKIDKYRNSTKNENELVND